MKILKIQFYNILGWITLSLGVIGAFLPILPTTPFVLLASYFFSKGSPKFYHWLLSSKLFGSIINNWNKYGVIDIKSKLIAGSFLVSVGALYFFYSQYSIYIKSTILCVFTLVLLFIFTRPSKPT